MMPARVLGDEPVLAIDIHMEQTLVLHERLSKKLKLLFRWDAAPGASRGERRILKERP